MSFPFSYKLTKMEKVKIAVSLGLFPVYISLVSVQVHTKSSLNVYFRLQEILIPKIIINSRHF